MKLNTIFFVGSACWLLTTISRLVIPEPSGAWHESLMLMGFMFIFAVEKREEEHANQ